jgi:hypothetical protein
MHMKNETNHMVRVRHEDWLRLKKASIGLYAPSMSEIVARGIELALAELEKRKR